MKKENSVLKIYLFYLTATNIENNIALILYYLIINLYKILFTIFIEEFIIK